MRYTARENPSAGGMELSQLDDALFLGAELLGEIYTRLLTWCPEATLEGKIECTRGSLRNRGLEQKEQEQ